MLDTLVRPTYVTEMWSHTFGLIETLAASHEVTNYRTAETGLVSAHLTNGNFPCISRQELPLTGNISQPKRPRFVKFNIA